MTEVTVKLRYTREAPRKIRLIVDTVRGLPLRVAIQNLAVYPQVAARTVRKLLVSAQAAARQAGLDDGELVVHTIYCDQGPALKRRLINSRGRASLMKKFTSHVTVTVAERATRKARS